MNCQQQNLCGGCTLRHLSEEEYRNQKNTAFKKLIAAVNQDNLNIAPAIFIADGSRRRVEFTFAYHKGSLLFGFNAAQSHRIIPIAECLSLTATINRSLPAITDFLRSLGHLQTSIKQKNKRQSIKFAGGKIFITEADNGLDIVLETDFPLTLELRIAISELVAANPQIIRFSVGAKNLNPETIVIVSNPYITVGGKTVAIPPATFLQPSVAGQNALIETVMKYVGDDSGKIADLFCGIGTFSYPLSHNLKNKITAIDSSEELLRDFQKNVNNLMIPNIQIIRRNLFKYPLTGDELKGFAVIVFDPPRAGASAQTAAIAQMPEADKPQKIIAISCNPYTFINDANTLLGGGYVVTEITPVDQFVYTNHLELVALFEKR